MNLKHSIFILLQSVITEKSRVENSSIQIDEETSEVPSIYGTILLPSIGVRIYGTNYYEVHLRGRYSSEVLDRVVREGIRNTQMAMLPESANPWLNFQFRSAYFLTFAMNNKESIKFTSLQLNEKDGPLINASSPSCANTTVDDNGIFSCSTTIPYSVSSANLQNNMIWFSPINVQIKNSILLTEEEGFSIISDIDDTVKITGVNSVKEAAKNVMFKPYEVTPGMAQYYWSLYDGLSIESSELSNNEGSSSIKPTFHFLSATAMQFVPAIQPFLLKHFPPFELIVNTLAVASGGLNNIRQYQEFKVNATHRMGLILRKKRFILIGDSTQKDPEAYGDTAREFGDRIICIFIRVVSGFNEGLEKGTLNTEERCAFYSLTYC